MGTFFFCLFFFSLLTHSGLSFLSLGFHICKDLLRVCASFFLLSHCNKLEEEKRKKKKEKKISKAKNLTRVLIEITLPLEIIGFALCVLSI